MNNDNDDLDERLRRWRQREVVWTPEELIDSDVSDAEFRTYQVLLGLADGDPTIVADRKMIAEFLHRSEGTIKRHLRGLERKQMLTLLQRTKHGIRYRLALWGKPSDAAGDSA